MRVGIDLNAVYQAKPITLQSEFEDVQLMFGPFSARVRRSSLLGQ